jgi:acetyl-CoA carboxylase biotin carboxylase subunit
MLVNNADIQSGQYNIHWLESFLAAAAKDVAFAGGTKMSPFKQLTPIAAPPVG